MLRELPHDAPLGQVYELCEKVGGDVPAEKKDHCATAFAARAKDALARGDPKEADSLLDKATKLSPSLADIADVRAKMPTAELLRDATSLLSRSEQKAKGGDLEGALGDVKKAQAKIVRARSVEPASVRELEARASRQLSVVNLALRTRRERDASRREALASGSPDDADRGSPSLDARTMDGVRVDVSSSINLPKGFKIAVLNLARPKSVTRDKAAYLTELLRQVMLKNLPQSNVITHENVLVFAQAVGRSLEDCDSECNVETGRLLGADVVVSGELLAVDKQLKLIVRLHETRGGRLLGSGIAGGRRIEELEERASRVAAELAGAIRVGGQ
jgi:hypothetical protein